MNVAALLGKEGQATALRCGASPLFQAHRLLAEKVLAVGDRIEIAVRVQVARDGADECVDPFCCQDFLPGDVGRSNRALLAGGLDGLETAYQVARVKVENGADGYAGDLQEVRE
ncbi:hypothetical protein EP7_003456 [Isosphaeraceae bacterium EP7]